MEYLITHSYKRLFRTPTSKYLCGQCSRRFNGNFNSRNYSSFRHKQVCGSIKSTPLKSMKVLRVQEIPNAVTFASVRDFTSGSHALLNVNHDDTLFNSRTQLSHQNLGPHVYAILQQQRSLSVSSAHKKDSKLEQTVEALKEGKLTVVPPKKRLWRRIVDEIVHYYHGFRLLGINIKVAFKLGIRSMRGYTLTRREHQLLVRTTADIFRLVPFSVFIVVPFAELALPLALKLFPDMLPTTFQTKDDKEKKLKTQLKVKLEVAKFLQDTLDQMSLQTKGAKNSESAKEFKEFFTRVRQSGAPPTTEEILKFSKLFKDDLTLDNLPRAHLMALCRMLELHAYGPSSFLTFQLRMALRTLKTDDKMIEKEGCDKLTTWELQQALKARGIRALGYTDAEMKTHLNGWLDLSLRQDIPPSLLLLTRAMSVTDVMPAVDQIAATIKELPESLGAQAEASLAEMEGKVDNKIRRRLVKEEEKKIKEERKEQEQMAREQARLDRAPSLQDPVEVASKEGITGKDLIQIQGAIQSMSAAKKKLLIEKEELLDLKEEIMEYQEDIQELKEEKQKAGMPAKALQERKAAQRVYKQINRMIRKMDTVIQKLEVDKHSGFRGLESGDKRDEVVSINEVVAAMRRLQKTPDNEKMKKIENVLIRMDVDQDGNISLDDVVKVFELLGNETSNITPRQMKEIVEMLKKEEALSMDEKMDKMVRTRRRK